MTRKVKRTKAYELTLEVRQDSFMSTPRADQRQWLLNRLMKEASDELEHAHRLAGQFVAGQPAAVAHDRAEADLQDHEIMEDWQVPIMRVMAKAVTRNGGDVLEIGMGRGVAAEFVQAYEPRSHTLVECNPGVIAGFEQWKQRFPGRDIRLLPSRWQDALDQMTSYDGLLFHTYPTNDEEFVRQVVQSVTFAEHFFDHARDLLRPGGVFTYLTNEADSLSRAHQRALLERFSCFSVSLVRGLPIPQDTRDSHWINQMVVVEAIK